MLTPLPSRLRGGFSWFARLPAFEAAVRPVVKDVEIILSTDWRHRHALDELRGYFSPAVAARIRGMTGIQRDLRETEIIEWLAHNPRTDWFAIDDRTDHFAQHKNRLVAINRSTGFTPDDAQHLLELVTNALAIRVTP